jgi:hypothetical protein
MPVSSKVQIKLALRSVISQIKAALIVAIITKIIPGVTGLRGGKVL